jgi:hypothetical protein
MVPAAEALTAPEKLALENSWHKVKALRYRKK